MASITVGQVSGLIAFGVLALQAILPLSIVVILVSGLRNEHNAVTWSVVARSVQASHWPALLRADSASSRKLNPRVSILTWLITLVLILLTVASIVTPLGLSDTIKEGNSIQAHFQYAQDLSPYGYGTPPRYNRFSRICGAVTEYDLPINCPGAYAGYQTFKNDTGSYIIPDFNDAIINSTIPSNLTEIFSSATSYDGSTLSGAFDIQHRTWAISADSGRRLVDAGKPYATGAFRTIDSLILHNRTEAVEGLIVDTVNGGVGYRNHTVPTRLQYGGSWIENLTWVEPVTACVDTNLTFRFTLGDTKVALVDNGGFVDLPRKNPYPNIWDDGQNPNLLARASQAAYMSNELTAFYLNVTYPGNMGPRNTAQGSQFPLTQILGPTFVPNQDAVNIDVIDGLYLDLMGPGGIGWLNLTPLALSITMDNFTAIGNLCQSWVSGDNANITNTLVRCGYLYGAPHRIDGVESLIFEPNSIWDRNLYVCASGVRASVKRVDFAFNGTSTLNNLKVIRVEDRFYPDNSSKPLWGVEDINFITNDVKDRWGLVGGVQRLWGLVGDRYEGATGLRTIRAEKFWLPTVSGQRTLEGPMDSLASTTVFGSALASTFGDEAGKYNGLNNMPLRRLWRELSLSSSSASKIINLIYSDILATASVGTKSALMASASRAGPGQRNALAYVTEYRRQVQYDLRYVIPGAIVLGITIVTVLVALAMWILSRFSVAAMRQLVNQTSTGRIATNFLRPDLCEAAAPTPEWIDKAGSTKLAFPLVLEDQATDSDSPGDTQLARSSTSMLVFEPSRGEKSRLHSVFSLPS